MKRFELRQVRDGVNTIVAEGVEFNSGAVAVEWRDYQNDISTHRHVGDLMRVRGANVTIEWIDTLPMFIINKGSAK